MEKQISSTDAKRLLILANQGKLGDIGTLLDRLEGGSLLDTLEKMGGMAKWVSGLLVEAGYDTVEKVRSATDDEFEAIDGISEKRIKAIRNLVGG